MQKLSKGGVFSDDFGSGALSFRTDLGQNKVDYTSIVACVLLRPGYVRY